jgi:hypothetical protein
VCASVASAGCKSDEPPKSFDAAGIGWEAASGRWTSNPGGVVCARSGVLLTREEHEDGTFEVDIEHAKSAETIKVWFRVPTKDWKRSSGYALELHPADGETKIFRWDDGLGFPLRELSEKLAVKPKNRVVVRSRGGHHEIDFNGARIATFDDGRYKKGRFGLECQAVDAPSTFSAIKIAR